MKGKKYTIDEWQRFLDGIDLIIDSTSDMTGIFLNRHKLINRIQLKSYFMVRILLLELVKGKKLETVLEECSNCLMEGRYYTPECLKYILYKTTKHLSEQLG